MIKDEEYRKIKKNILNLIRPFKDPILWPKIKFAYFYFNVSEKKCYPRNQIKPILEASWWQFVYKCLRKRACFEQWYRSEFI